MVIKSNSRVLALGNITMEKRVFYVFLVAATFLLGSYLYLINQSVFNIAYSQKANYKIDQLKTQVASLEEEYMSLSSEKISQNYANSLGFKEVSGGQNYTSADKKVSLLVNNEI